LTVCWLLLGKSRRKTDYAIYSSSLKGSVISPLNEVPGPFSHALRKTGLAVIEMTPPLKLPCIVEKRFGATPIQFSAKSFTSA
jgi:hypothetical protein